MNLHEQLENLKGRASDTPGNFQYFGRSLYDKIQNLRKSEKNIITHVFFPEGSAEKAKKLAGKFKAQFGLEAPDALLSFYEIFDGYEFRYIVFDPDFITGIFQEYPYLRDALGNDFPELSIAEMQKPELRDYVGELAVTVGIPDFRDLNQVEGRMTSHQKKGEQYYLLDNDYNFRYGIRTMIPDAERLFDPGNTPSHYKGDLKLFFFDYFSDFFQVMIGIKDHKLDLYQVKYGSGDITRIREDLPAYLKKYLVR